MILGIPAVSWPWLSPQHSQTHRRGEVSIRENAQCIGAEEVTSGVFTEEENNSWISQSPTFTWQTLLQSHPGKLHDIFITVIFRPGHYL